MQVVTVRLDEDLVEDLDAEAGERGYRNRTEYVRNLLRNRERIQENTDTDAGEYERLQENTEANTREYERIRDRVDALEARVDALEGGGRRDRDGGRREEAGEGSQDVGNDTGAVRERVLDELGDGPPRKSFAREAIADAVALLVAEGPLATGDLKNALYPEYEEHYSTKRTMWNSLDRHLETVEGVSKPGYGEWDAE